jgi:hypothetical protein
LVPAVTPVPTLGSAPAAALVPTLALVPALALMSALARVAAPFLVAVREAVTMTILPASPRAADATRREIVTNICCRFWGSRASKS